MRRLLILLVLAAAAWWWWASSRPLTYAAGILIPSEPVQRAIEPKALGEIDATFDPMDLAEFLLASWEGAILRMKVERGPAALERFKTIAFQTVFKEQK